VISYDQKSLWIPSPLPFFLFGFFYYLITPFFVVTYFPEFSLVKTAEKFIHSSYFDMRYLIDCVLIISSWGCGYFSVLKIKSKVGILDRFSKFKIAPILLAFIFLSFLFFLLISSLLKGSTLFSGYASYDVAMLGQLSTLVFMSVWFINYFQNRHVTKIYIILFCVASILLLGFGSRMFFVLSVISLTLGYVSRYNKKLFSPSFLLFSSSLLIFVVWVGVWRSDMKLSSDALVFIFFAEPIFTATSGALYLDNFGGRPILSFPVDAFASVINFIPTIIFPEKLQVLNAITYNKYKASPFGASSLIVNLYSNFGVFYPAYLFMMGLMYGYLKKRAESSVFYRTVYFSLLPLLMFHFFREGFITVFKVIFFNGFILPAATAGCLYLLFSKKVRIL